MLQKLQSKGPNAATLILYDSACSFAASEIAAIGTLCFRKPLSALPLEVLLLRDLDRSTRNGESAPNVSADGAHLSTAKIDGLRSENGEFVQAILSGTNKRTKQTEMIVEICSRLYGLNSTRFIERRLMFRRFIIRSGRSIVFEIPFNSVHDSLQYNHD